MGRDTLFLLQPDFEDPAYPGKRFYCWHCALIEGVLSAFPALSKSLDVQRVAWPRPRSALVLTLGVENQSLPALMLEPGAVSKHQTGSHNGRGFVTGHENILKVLSDRHGFPEPHP